MKILIVEDDIVFHYSLKDILNEEGYRTYSAENYQEAMRVFLDKKIDLILLDIELPDGSGLDLCKNIRHTSQVPILFLTGQNNEDTLVEGLNSGGDDYVIKPFRMKELLARIQSLLRRSQPNPYVKIGDLCIDFQRNEIFKNNIKIELPKTEFEIFKVIFLNQNQVITRERLLEIIEKDGQNYVENNTLSVYLKRIREKIGTYQGMSYIETVRGVGYRVNLGVIYGNE